MSLVFVVILLMAAPYRACIRSAHAIEGGAHFLRLRAVALALFTPGGLARHYLQLRPVGLALRLLRSCLSLITIHGTPLFQKNVLIVSIKA
jgi:hypothetical protein